MLGEEKIVDYAKALSSEQKADCAGIYIFWG